MMFVECYVAVRIEFQCISMLIERQKVELPMLGQCNIIHVHIYNPELLSVWKEGETPTQRIKTGFLPFELTCFYLAGDDRVICSFDTYMYNVQM